MNASASQCGSSCESGWTIYLDQKSFDEEEGLSMVSEASSGPGHYGEDEEDGSFCSAPPAAPEPAKFKKRNKNKRIIKEDASNQYHSCLEDDTASSPKNCSKEASADLLDFSQDFSGTYFKGQSAFQKKFVILKYGKAGSKDAAGGFEE
ncbi:Detected protein of unknown function [Hibiscus syriacus]|uniref:Uncharacterized protein n=1 Tax=Hibiscus syriacus TaxID=106335 RepID=A0A6A2ZWR0_HIBSY|nr:Detected protein of unknown function [Hibiscus syriacus]